MEINLQELKDLGFTKASEGLKEKQALAKRLMVAYEHYRAISPEHIEAFQKALKARTLTRTGREGFDLTERYDTLVFKRPEEYSEIPPADVLAKMKEAKALNVFDYFEIAKIESVVEYKDPLLLGRIDGCEDRFFVAQWDNDVKIGDLLKDGEG